jgi:hypothetical protein
VPSTKYCSPIRPSTGDVRFGWILGDRWVLFTDRYHEQQVLVLPEGYYASPKRIVKALEAMKHEKGMKKGFNLGMSEVDHKFSSGMHNNLRAVPILVARGIYP